MIIQSEFSAQNRKLIENSKLLGCSVYVTDRTLEEFRVLMEKAKNILTTLKATPEQMSKGNNALIRAYGKTILGGSSISKSDFINVVSEVERFLGTMGIEVFDENHEEMSEYSNLVEQVSNCYMIMRHRPKKFDVAEHDAFHLLLIKSLREPDTDSIMGPNFWFLSSDLTLSCAERFVNRKFNFSNNTPAVMVVSFWNELISPFLAGIVTQKDMVEVLKYLFISEFTPISEGIDVETLAKLEIDWTEYDWLEIEEIIQLTKQKFVLRYLARREEISKTGDDEAIRQLRSEFNIPFSRSVGQISSRKIEQVKAQLKQKELETASLRASVKNLEDTKGELGRDLISEKNLSLAMRYVAGFSGLALLIIGISLIILMKDSATWQVVSSYIVSLLLGGFLLLMAIKPEQVSAWIGLGRKK